MTTETLVNSGSGRSRSVRPITMRPRRSASPTASAVRATVAAAAPTTRPLASPDGLATTHTQPTTRPIQANGPSTASAVRVRAGRSQASVAVEIRHSPAITGAPSHSGSVSGSRCVPVNASGTDAATASHQPSRRRRPSSTTAAARVGAMSSECIWWTWSGASRQPMTRPAATTMPAALVAPSGGKLRSGELNCGAPESLSIPRGRHA